MPLFEQASRMKNAPLSKIREIIDYSQKLDEEGKPIVHLEIGEPDYDTPNYIIEAAKQALDDQKVHYGPVIGTLQARQAIRDWLEKKYGLNYEPSEVLITHGVAHGIFMAVMAYLNTGDEILVPDPGYLCYFTVPNIAGAKAVSYRLKAEDNYQISEEYLESLINKNTKAIMLNSPSNPCGALLNIESLETVAKLAEKYNLLIITDDVYGEIVYDGKIFHTIAQLQNMKKRTIILNGFSKYFSMTGWRIGYIVCDKSLMDPLMRLGFYSISCPNTFVQTAAVEALEHDDADSQKMVTEYQERRDYMYQALNSLEGCSCQKPDGAFYIFLDIRGTHMSSDEFCLYMLEKYHVTMTPGHVFGQYGEGFVRISYANSLPNLKIAIERMREALKALKNT